MEVGVESLTASCGFSGAEKWSSTCASSTVSSGEQR